MNCSFFEINFLILKLFSFYSLKLKSVEESVGFLRIFLEFFFWILTLRIKSKMILTFNDSFQEKNIQGLKTKTRQLIKTIRFFIKSCKVQPSISTHTCIDQSFHFMHHYMYNISTSVEHYTIKIITFHASTYISTKHTCISMIHNYVENHNNPHQIQWQSGSQHNWPTTTSFSQ